MLLSFIHFNIFSTTNCNALFNLINKIKGSIKLNNILAQSRSLNTTPYHPRHTTMPQKKQVIKFTRII